MKRTHASARKKKIEINLHTIKKKHGTKVSVIERERTRAWIKQHQKQIDISSRNKTKRMKKKNNKHSQTKANVKTMSTNTNTHTHTHLLRNRERYELSKIDPCAALVMKSVRPKSTLCFGFVRTHDNLHIRTTNKTHVHVHERFLWICVRVCLWCVSVCVRVSIIDDWDL